MERALPQHVVPVGPQADSVLLAQADQGNRTLQPWDLFIWDFGHS